MDEDRIFESSAYRDWRRSHVERLAYTLISLGMVIAAFGALYFLFLNFQYDPFSPEGVALACVAVGVAGATTGAFFILLSRLGAGATPPDFERQLASLNLIEAWSSFAATARQIVEERGVSERMSPTKYIEALSVDKLLEPDEIEELHSSLRIRNAVVHGESKFSPSVLFHSALTVSAIIDRLRGRRSLTPRWSSAEW